MEGDLRNGLVWSLDWTTSMGDEMWTLDKRKGAGFRRKVTVLGCIIWGIQREEDALSPLPFTFRVEWDLRNRSDVGDSHKCPLELF